MFECTTGRWLRWMFAVPGPGPCSCVVTWPSIRSSVAGTRFCTSAKQLYVDTHTHIYIYIHTYIYIYICSTFWRYHTSSTAQGGGGSFKNRKPIGDVGCCESRMAERIHWLTERWLELCLLEWLQWLQWSPHPQLLDVVWCTATVVVVVA